VSSSALFAVFHLSTIVWLVALLAHLPGTSISWKNVSFFNCWIIEKQVALGTGFGTLFRGIGMSPLGPAGFLMMSSFRPSGRSGYIIGYFPIQTHTRASRADNRSRCRRGKACRLLSWSSFWCFAQLITRIQRQTNLIGSLPLDVQRAVRDANSASIKVVFNYAACLTILGYIVRLGVSSSNVFLCSLPVFSPFVIDTRERTQFTTKYCWASRSSRSRKWRRVRTRRECGIIRKRCCRGEGWRRTDVWDTD
jgi:hypothetical protein